MINYFNYFLLLFLLIPANAQALSYQNHIVFSGYVTSVFIDINWDNSHFPPPKVGDTFTGSVYYSFSDNTKPVTGEPAIYDPSYTTGLTIDYGLYFNSFMVKTGSSVATVAILANTSHGDSFTVWDLVPENQPGSISADDVYIRFIDPSARSINESLLLPNSFENFSYGNLTIVEWPLGGFGLDGYIDNISTVSPAPEPASMLLFSVGLLGLASVKLRKRGKIPCN